MAQDYRLRGFCTIFPQPLHASAIGVARRDAKVLHMEAIVNVAAHIKGAGFFAKLIGIAIIGMLLLWPVESIRDLVEERMERSASVTAEMGTQWGPEVEARGPYLVVPRINSNQLAYILPAETRIDVNLPVESRHRGIFTVPTYRGELVVQSVFDGARLAALGEQSELDLARGELVMLFTLGSAPSSNGLIWNGVALTASVDDVVREKSSAVVARVDASGLTAGKRIELNWKLAAQGISRLEVAPTAPKGKITMHSPWPGPSFVGDVLPTRRSVGPAGFEAAWDNAGSKLPELSIGTSLPTPVLMVPTAGVRLVDPVDHYTQVERSVKYASLVILLTFAVFILFELTAKLRVHPVQYVFVGCALVLFYLLLLSTSEHTGFTVAYAIAATATTALVGAYTSAVLHAKKRAALVSVELAATYGILYVIMSAESFALLAGATMLFVVLATIMFVTRKIDWYALSAKPVATPATATPVSQ